MPKNSCSACQKGGSLASDAVSSHVSPSAFTKMNAMFDNTVAPTQKGGRLCKVCRKAKCCHKKSSKCGGNAIQPAYSYNGAIVQKVQPGAEPSRAVYLSRGGLRHISSFSDKDNYRLKNRLVGGVASDQTLAVGMNSQYQQRITTSASQPVSGAMTKAPSYNPIDVVKDMNYASVPAPIYPVMYLGAPTSTGALPQMSTPAGGGLVKKAIAAAVAYKITKKVVKKYKEAKEKKEGKKVAKKKTK